MMFKNYELWKEIYEEEYHIPLSYTTQEDKAQQLEGFVPVKEESGETPDVDVR
jgi:hypothetical protein